VAGGDNCAVDDCDRNVAGWRLRCAREPGDLGAEYAGQLNFNAPVPFPCIRETYVLLQQLTRRAEMLRPIAQQLHYDVGHVHTVPDAGGPVAFGSQRVLRLGADAHRARRGDRMGRRLRVDELVPTRPDEAVLVTGDPNESVM
jgi:hypothetical protein